ncbi:hypothetical protein Gohar_016517, partial [Gossypium harknessii]|nr:hypothetical protein [Gossypium harknessii]
MSPIPFISILTENKLNGDNFLEWKRNLLIVLSLRNTNSFLTKRALLKLSPKQEITGEIMTRLGQVTLARQFAITNLMNFQQKVGTPVKEHMVMLMGFFAEANDNGDELDVNTAAYNLGKKALTLTQLMKELQSYELMLNYGQSGKQKNKGKKKSTKSSVPPRVDRKNANKSKDPKKIKCFFCKRKWHFKSNCNEYLEYLAEKGKGMELFVGFNEMRSLCNRSLSLRTRDGSYVLAKS